MRKYHQGYVDYSRPVSYRPIFLIILILLAAFLIFKSVGGTDSSGGNFEAQRNANLRSEMQHAMSSLNSLSRNGATSSSATLSKIRQYVHGIELLNEMSIGMYGELGRIYEQSLFDQIYSIIDTYDVVLSSGQKVNETLASLTDALNMLNTRTTTKLEGAAVSST